MTSASTGWVKFFKDAGLPPDLSAKYAVMFTDHRIQKDMLGDLDRDILSDIGVVPVGDKMAILKHARFMSEQAKRDQSSKLLADGVKTLESRPNKGTSPAARMLNHEINKRSSPASGRSSPASSSDQESKKSVFQRLANKSQSASPSKRAGVFDRLGKETEGEPLPYAGVLKKSPSPVTVAKKQTVPEPVAKKPKATSVLDRLGAPKSENIPDSSSQKKASTSKLIRLKKSVLLSKKAAVTRKPTSTTGITITKPAIQKVTTKKPSVLDRLGAVVTSTTASDTASDPVTRGATKTTKRKLILKVPKKNLVLKRKSNTDLEAVARKKPISSNTVSSTSSAGIFRREGAEGQSVFSRLGKKMMQ